MRRRDLEEPNRPRVQPRGSPAFDILELDQPLASRSRLLEAFARGYSCFVLVFPGQTPVSSAYALAPARSTSALNAPDTAPWIAAAATTSRHVWSPSFALGALSSSATARQRRLKRAPARTPPAMLASRPNGL